MEYFWRVELEDGSTLQQFDADGEEILFSSVDLTRVRVAAWVPIRHLTGEETVGGRRRRDVESDLGYSVEGLVDAPGWSVRVEPGQEPILRRRHEVKGDQDTLTGYVIGVRDEEGVLGEHYINPDPPAGHPSSGTLVYERANARTRSTLRPSRAARGVELSEHFPAADPEDDD